MHGLQPTQETLLKTSSVLKLCRRHHHLLLHLPRPASSRMAASRSPLGAKRARSEALHRPLLRQRPLLQQMPPRPKQSLQTRMQFQKLSKCPLSPNRTPKLAPRNMQRCARPPCRTPMFFGLQMGSRLGASVQPAPLNIPRTKVRRGRHKSAASTPICSQAPLPPEKSAGLSALPARSYAPPMVAPTGVSWTHPSQTTSPAFMPLTPRTRRYRLHPASSQVLSRPIKPRTAESHGPRFSPSSN